MTRDDVIQARCSASNAHENNLCAAQADCAALADLALLALDLAAALGGAVADRDERTRRHTIGHGQGRPEEACWAPARAALARFEVATRDQLP